MSALVIVLRMVSLLAFAGPMLLGVSRHHGESKARASQERGGRAPMVANLAAFGVFFPTLLISSGSSDASMALPLALSGCLLAMAGAALVLRSRAELGPAWSFVPKADQGTGLVTTGPYRLVRHPIYLGLALVAMGQALAFGSGPALMIMLSGIVPTFAWRARVEEKLLSRAFGERYAVYRQRTRMIPFTIRPRMGRHGDDPLEGTPVPHTRVGGGGPLISDVPFPRCRHLRGGRTHMTGDARSEKPRPAAVPEVANVGVVRPPLIHLTAILLGVGLHLAWPVGLVARPQGAWLGGAAILLAIALFVSAVRTFRAAGTPVPGHRPTTTIVRTGPYRFSRNPIYLAFSLLQLGLALWIDTLWLIVTLLPAVALMALVVIPREEQYLEARFPLVYPSYKASVRRWL
jgi:protein-S-isoprenylcysteine O-methyltransferase Ste14